MFEEQIDGVKTSCDPYFSTDQKCTVLLVPSIDENTGCITWTITYDCKTDIEKSTLLKYFLQVVYKSSLIKDKCPIC